MVTQYSGRAAAPDLELSDIRGKQGAEPWQWTNLWVRNRRGRTSRHFTRRQADFRRLDAAALGDDYVGDARIESPFAGIHQGRGAAAAVQRFFDAFRGLEIECEPPIIDGERVAQFFTFSGAGVGKLMGLPPSNKPFRFSAVHLYRLRGLKIVEERRLYDSTGLWVQIGVLKAKPT